MYIVEFEPIKLLFCQRNSIKIHLITKAFQIKIITTVQYDMLIELYHQYTISQHYSQLNSSLF